MSDKLISLQEAVFRTILNQFSLFVSAYLTTKNEDLKENFYFLQRFYTQTLLDELERTRKLKADHLELLLNKHLKIMRVKVLRRHISLDTIADKLKLIGPSLIELDFEKTLDYYEEGSFFGSIMNPQEKRFLKKSNVEQCLNIVKQFLPHVYNVSKVCIDNYCTDDMLELLAASCPHLTELIIIRSTITSEGLKSLCVEADNIVVAQCPLKVIDLSFIEGIEEGIAFILKHIPTLEVVKSRLLPYVLHNIDKLHNDTTKYNLTYMNFYQCKENLLNYLKLCLKMCPHLKRIKLNISNEAELEFCALFNELESLSLRGLWMNINNFLISNGRKLKYLCLSSLKLSVSTLIQSCPNLEKLCLSAVEFQQPDNITSVPFSWLLILKVSYWYFDQNACRKSMELLLSSCPHLQKLFLLFGTHHETEIFYSLHHFPFNNSLKLLYLYDMDVCTDGLKQIIINSNSLATLFIAYCLRSYDEEVEILHQTITDYHKNILLVVTDF